MMMSIRNSKHPSHCFSSYPGKLALLDHLIQPWILNRRLAMALRVTWRDTDSLDEAWKNIVAYRERCDSIVGNLPQVDFYVSCLTGVYTKCGTKGANAFAQPIYPGIGYWIANKEGTLETLMQRINAIHPPLGELFPKVHIKPITIHSNLDPTNEDLNALGAPLFAVMKDHANGYIQRRTLESMEHMGRVSMGISMTTVAKLCVVNRDLLRDLQMTAHQLYSRGLHLSVEAIQPLPKINLC